MLKNVKTEAVFTKTEMKNEYNIFSQIVLLVFNSFILLSSPLRL